MWRRRPRAAAAPARGGRPHGVARPQLLWPARLPARRRPVAGGAWRQASGEGRGDPHPERQLCLQPVHERPLAAGGLHGLGRQPGATGRGRADGRAARRPTGNRHRPAPGRPEERAGLRPCRLQGIAAGHADHCVEDRRVADWRRTGAQPHQLAVRLRCLVRQPVPAPGRDPRQWPGELRRNPQGRRLWPPAGEWRADRPGLFRWRCRLDRRLCRAQPAGPAEACTRAGGAVGRGAAGLCQPGQPAGFHHCHLG
ncbi:hypothetical protein D3C76_774440 [compost metagenome]